MRLTNCNKLAACRHARHSHLTKQHPSSPLSHTEHLHDANTPCALLAVSFTRAVVFSFFPTKSAKVLSRCISFDANHITAVAGSRTSFISPEAEVMKETGTRLKRVFKGGCHSGEWNELSRHCQVGLLL